MTNYVYATLCVVGLAIGQVLFKLGADRLAKGSGLLSLDVLAVLGSAAVIYVATTAAWIWVLQKGELGKLYPLMALAFVLVPVGCHLVLGERFNGQYFLGVAFIMAGIVIATTV